ncbi:hypothetical protein ACNKHO_05945 [Shigella flexneri]
MQIRLIALSGVEGAFQRRHDLLCTGSAVRRETHRFTGARTFCFGLLQTLAQPSFKSLLPLAFLLNRSSRNARDVSTTSVRANACDGLRAAPVVTRRNLLLTAQTVAGRLKHRSHRSEFRQLIAVLLHKARSFLCLIQTFPNFIDAVGERIIR